jgi:uracil-DNA glycosylase
MAQLPLTGEETSAADALMPERKTLKRLREAAARCKACPLWESGTQTVFGEGLKRSRLMLIGEQPGDREDREGKPFVGPAGRELDRGLDQAGIDRGEAYVTNVVKHFKFEERGNRRIHKTPKRFEIDACLPWLNEELKLLAPEAVVLLGATAGKAILGASFRVTKERGQPIDSDLAPLVTATIHPSAILRAPDEAARRAERDAFAADLRLVADALG